MILGRTAIGANAVAIREGNVYLWDVDVPELAGDVVIGALVAYLDGAGGGSGEQVIRPVAASAVAGPVWVGEPITVTEDQPAGWQYLVFDIPPTLREGDPLLLGILGGAADQVARILGLADAPAGRRWAGMPYPAVSALGAPTQSNIGTAASVVLVGVEPWQPPAVSNEQLAGLPLDVAMDALGVTGPVAAPVAATAGWRYLHDDPPDPAACIVRSDGPLAGLVGERIRVTRVAAGGVPLTVALYVDDEEDFDPELAGEDLQLARGAFERLAPLWTDALPVIVEVLA
jgi:hypothetical protein